MFKNCDYRFCARQRKRKKGAVSALSFSSSFHAAFIGEPLEKESEFSENTLQKGL